MHSVYTYDDIYVKRPPMVRGDSNDWGLLISGIIPGSVSGKEAYRCGSLLHRQSSAGRNQWFS